MPKAKKTQEPQPPRFAIMNTCDAPQRRMVCEWVPRVGYCYMMRNMEPHMKVYDGMKPPKPTAIQDFGFDVDIMNGEAIFQSFRPSSATYEDGKMRDWQDSVWTTRFCLPLVKGPYRKGSRANKGI